MTSIIHSIPVSFSRTDQIVLWLSRHWFLVISFVLGLYVLIPFLAPVFMAVGLTGLGKAIYWIYSFLCHQLPERSYFLFGQKVSYGLTEIKAVWPGSENIAVLRQFVGNSAMGWKVAWSDRMVSMFTSLWAFGMLWGLFKKKITALPWWGFLLMLLPMAIDGTTHFISDLSGLGEGFRDTNFWLQNLTNQMYPLSFYRGDAWGSFNAWMRLISGILFGLAIVWYGFPYIKQAFSTSAEVVNYRHQYQTILRNEKERLLNQIPVGQFYPDLPSREKKQ